MFDMDFKSKGITWVGNVYNKFEAMCNEVEDVLTNQETTKYFENQVQRAGGNIKKFCAEVMNDMLPPSSEECVKMIGSDILVDAEFRSCVKSKDNLGKENVPVKNLEVIAPAVKDSSLVSFLGGVPQITHLLPRAAADYDFSEQSRTDFLKNSELATKHEPVEENPTIHYVSKVIDSISGGSTQPSLLRGTKDNVCLCSSSPAYTVKKRSSKFTEQNENVEECQNSVINDGGDSYGNVSSWGSISDISFEEIDENSSAALKKITSTKCGGTNDSNILGKAFEDINTRLGSSVVLCEKEVTEVRPLTPSKGRFDDGDAELQNSGDAFEPGVENIEQFDNVKLEDSCITVQPFALSSSGPRQKSYKKKICHALTSRIGLSKKKEYEQLAIWHAGIDGETGRQITRSCTSSTLTTSVDSKNLSTEDICEWEVL